MELAQVVQGQTGSLGSAGVYDFESGSMPRLERGRGRMETQECVPGASDEIEVKSFKPLGQIDVMVSSSKGGWSYGEYATEDGIARFWAKTSKKQGETFRQSFGPAPDYILRAPVAAEDKVYNFNDGSRNMNVLMPKRMRKALRFPKALMLELLSIPDSQYRPGRVLKFRNPPNSSNWLRTRLPKDWPKHRHLPVRLPKGEYNDYFRGFNDDFDEMCIEIRLAWIEFCDFFRQLWLEICHILA